MSLKFHICPSMHFRPGGNEAKCKEVWVTTMRSSARDSFWVYELQGYLIRFAQLILQGPYPAAADSNQGDTSPIFWQ